MLNWKETLVKKTAAIREALQIIDRAGIQAAFVVDDSGRLLGVVTDGDVRRGILRGVGINAPVTEVWNTNPRAIHQGASRNDILQLMQSKALRQIPIVDNDGRLIGIEVFEDFLSPIPRDHAVVLMAGGRGKRLFPLTEDCPKPMLKVGEKPILELILEQFCKNGFRRFFLSVNYKAEMVESHFGNGSKWNAEVEYLRESKPLGTAGSLSLLPKLDKPLIVMNGDLLTTVNFDGLLQFHAEKQAMVTMCIRQHTYEVPFGVVQVDGYAVTHIEEKPIQSFFVNGGIYVLSPSVLKHIPKDTFFDMPDLMSTLIRESQTVAAFPVREYWLDIGRTDDFERARGDVLHVFGKRENE
jgi:dTDP-glucose pyrophosphorylase